MVLMIIIIIDIVMYGNWGYIIYMTISLLIIIIIGLIILVIINHNIIVVIIWLVVEPPLWKIWVKVSWDDEIPNAWTNKKWQPNHQPVITIRNCYDSCLLVIFNCNDCYQGVMLVRFLITVTLKIFHGKSNH